MDDWCVLSMDDTLIEISHASPTQQQHLLLDDTQNDNDGGIVVINHLVIDVLPMDDAIITQDEFIPLQNTITNEENVTSNHLIIKHLVENIIEDLLEDLLEHTIQNKHLVVNIKHKDAHSPLIINNKIYAIEDDACNTNNVCGVAILIPSNIIDYNLDCIRIVKKYSSFIFLVNSLKISYTSSITSRLKV